MPNKGDDTMHDVLIIGAGPAGCAAGIFSVRRNLKTLIFATGAKHRKGLVKGEDEFSGRGVSYCASCDAPMYKGKKVFVLGGGDSALMYALLLDQVGADTTIIHRRDEFRGAESWAKKLDKSNVKKMLSTVALEIKGDTMVKSVVLMDKKTQEKTEVKVDGIFVAFGTVPTSELARKAGVKLDESGYIIASKGNSTSVPCVFAAGDCVSGSSKKIAVAVGAGAVAAESAYDYIKGN